GDHQGAAPGRPAAGVVQAPQAAPGGEHRPGGRDAEAGHGHLAHAEQADDLRRVPGRRRGRNESEAGTGVRKGVGQGAPRGGFSAWVPIPNGRGRPRAAPFGLGPWDGARVAPQQGPTLRPGQRYYRRPEGAVEPDRAERRLKGSRCGPVVRSELPGGSLRSLPFGPTRDVSWMRRAGLARAGVRSAMLWVEWAGRRGIRTS